MKTITVPSCSITMGDPQRPKPSLIRYTCSNCKLRHFVTVKHDADGTLFYDYEDHSLIFCLSRYKQFSDPTVSAKHLILCGACLCGVVLLICTKENAGICYSKEKSLSRTNYGYRNAPNDFV